MTSALGFTADHFGAARRASGERAWYALYAGVPASPEGGLVKRDWFDQWRLPSAPLRPVSTVVGVDPSDSGSDDSCGIVAASMTADGVVAVIADQSAPMTSDAWARAAVDLAVDVGASEIAVEGYAARQTYRRVVNDALHRAKLDRPIRATTSPPKGSGRGHGDAVASSSALLQGLETGTCRIAGHFPSLEARRSPGRPVSTSPTRWRRWSSPTTCWSTRWARKSTSSRRSTSRAAPARAHCRRRQPG